MPNLEILRFPANQKPARGTVLLVHGACMGAWAWEDNLLPWFAQQGFNSVAMSFRNHGGSGPRGGLKFKSVHEYVADLAEVVHQLEGPIYLVGHSMGGFVIQHYLSRTADSRIQKAVLLCAAPPHGNFSVLGRLMSHATLGFIQSNLLMSWKPVLMNRKYARKIMFTDHTPEKKIEDTIERMQDESFLVFLEMMALNLPDAKRIKTPLCIIGAEKDFLVSEKDTRKMAATYGVKPVIIPQAPHNLMLEPGWEQTAKIILEFIAPIPQH